MAKANQKARTDEQQKFKLLVQYAEEEGKEGGRISFNGLSSIEADAFLTIDAIATQMKLAYRKTRNERIEEAMKKKEEEASQEKVDELPSPPVEEPTE